MHNQLRIVLLWILLVICMILHFDYHVSELFYGIDIKKPGANGVIPATIVLIRTAFHFLPVLYSVGLMWWSSQKVRIVNIALSVIYALANAAHFAGEVKKGDNPSQMILLGVAVLVSVMLIVASRGWVKQKEETITQ